METEHARLLQQGWWLAPDLVHLSGAPAMSGVGQIINAAVTDFYRDGPRNESGPAGQIIAALGWRGFWISEDVTPWSNQAVAIVQELSREIGKIDLPEWAGSNILRQRQVDEIKRIQALAAKITSKHSPHDAQGGGAA